MTYRTIYTEVEVEVDLGDFETDDLIDELESRGADLVTDYGDGKEILETIYYKRRLGRTDYEKELDQLIYHALGKIV